MTDLGICYAQPFWFDGNSYTTNNTSIIFPLHVGRDHFDRIRLFVPFNRTTGEQGPLALRLGEEGSLVPGLDPERITVHPLPFRSRTRQWYTVSAGRDIFETARVLRDGLPECDLVWMPAPPHVPTILCYSLCQMADIPSFLYVRSDQRREIAVQDFSGIVSIKKQLGGRVLPRIERHMVERIPTVVAGPGLSQKYAGDARSLHVVRSVHLSERHVISDPRTEWSRPLRLLYVGRLVPVKGVRRLVSAAERLVDRGHDVTLDIVGTGKKEEALRKQAASSSISDRITFRGFVPFGPDLFEQYRRADVFVLPSYSEGFPNVLLESMANGTPVITTDVGGISEVVSNGNNGLLVPARDTDAIVRAVSQLITDDQLYASLVQSGRKTVVEYTVERQTARLIGVVEEEFPGLCLG